MVFADLYATCTNAYRGENPSGPWSTKGVPSGQAVLVFPTSSTSMLEIFVGFARVNVSRPLIMAEGALGCVPCLVRPVPSPVRRKTTDSVSRIDSEFFMGGKRGGSRRDFRHSRTSFMVFRFFHFPAQRSKQIVWTRSVLPGAHSSAVTATWGVPGVAPPTASSPFRAVLDSGVGPHEKSLDSMHRMQLQNTFF